MVWKPTIKFAGTSRIWKLHAYTLVCKWVCVCVYVSLFQLVLDHDLALQCYYSLSQNISINEHACLVEIILHTICILSRQLIIQYCPDSSSPIAQWNNWNSVLVNINFFAQSPHGNVELFLGWIIEFCIKWILRICISIISALIILVYVTNRITDESKVKQLRGDKFFLIKYVYFPDRRANSRGNVQFFIKI